VERVVGVVRVLCFFESHRTQRTTRLSAKGSLTPHRFRVKVALSGAESVALVRRGLRFGQGNFEQ
jgi:hypothetical protein